jgi:hypothetical protein
MILTSQQVLALDNSILMPELSESQLTWLFFHDAMAPPFVAIAPSDHSTFLGIHHHSSFLLHHLIGTSKIHYRVVGG